MTFRVWFGESLRWYLKRARHPLKNYLVGHYWRLFAKQRVWIRYDGWAVVNVGLGDYLQQQIFFDGYYERPLVEWLKATLRSDDVFWDVGANIGAISLVAAPHCRKVVSFEPDPRSVQRLTRNIEANHLAHVEVIPGALGVEAGVAPLYQADSLNSGMTSLIAGRGNVTSETEVTVLRADDLIASRPELTPTVMKLDVEGAEHLVLAGAAALLRSGRLRAIVFEDRRDANAQPTNHELVERLLDAGYRIVPFASSDTHADDDMFNFLATPNVATGRGTLGKDRVLHDEHSLNPAS
jgi:FkbM family methyltransferase